VVLRPVGEHLGSFCEHVGAPLWQVQGDRQGLGCRAHRLLGGSGLAFLAAPHISPVQVLSEVWEGVEVSARWEHRKR